MVEVVDVAKDKLGKFEIYLKSNHVSPLTLNNYLSIISKFLKFVKDPLDLKEWDARDYLASIYDRVSKNTTYVNYYALASFYKSQNIPFAIDAPEVDPDPKQLTITPEGIAKMILIIKEQGSPDEKGVLSLSTVYGVRRIEIMRGTKNDLNYDNKTIVIHTAKKGRVQIHSIPVEVFDNIMGFSFKPRSTTSYATLFWNLVDKAGLQLEDGYGFHSIRRALYTGLSANGVDYFIRHAFMRWKIRGLELDAIYDHSKVDEAVFQKHPFLKLWRHEG